MSANTDPTRFDARLRSDNTILVPEDIIKLNKLKTKARITFKIENVIFVEKTDK